MKSESGLVWRFILFLFKLPYLLVMISLGKKNVNVLFKPLKDFWNFIYEAKITFWLIVINIIVFIIEIFLVLNHPELINKFIFQPQDLWQFNLIPIVSSWFMHAGFAHLFGNMLFLFIFGRVVENEFKGNMLVIYFLSAIIADLLSAVMGLGGIGASGAIAGLIATGILLKPFYMTYIVVGIPIPLFLVGWLAILADISGVLVPQNTMVNHYAHLGGYITIALIVLLVSRDKKSKMIKGFLINLVLFILLLLFAFVFGM